MGLVQFPFLSAAKKAALMKVVPRSRTSKTGRFLVGVFAGFAFKPFNNEAFWVEVLFRDIRLSWTFRAGSLLGGLGRKVRGSGAIVSRIECSLSYLKKKKNKIENPTANLRYLDSRWCCARDELETGWMGSSSDCKKMEKKKRWQDAQVQLRLEAVDCHMAQVTK